jgi:hypothetical protein
MSSELRFEIQEALVKHAIRHSNVTHSLNSRWTDLMGMAADLNV